MNEFYKIKLFEKKIAEIYKFQINYIQNTKILLATVRISPVRITPIRITDGILIGDRTFNNHVFCIIDNYITMFMAFANLFIQFHAEIIKINNKGIFLEHTTELCCYNYIVMCDIVTNLLQCLETSL